MTHLKAIRDAVKTDAILLTSRVSQRYSSGFDFTDGYVLITQKHAYIITDFRYIEAAKKSLAPGFEALMPDNGMLVTIRALLTDDAVKTVAYEDRTLPCADLERIKGVLAGFELVPENGLLDGVRLVKDSDEIATMTRAQKITDDAFTHILGFIKPEMTEIEVALELEFFMRRNGAQCTAFDTICVSGSASSLPHGVPRNVRLEKGFLTMDFGASVDGYCSDMTRTVVIGRADAEMKKIYNTVSRAQSESMAMIKEGVSAREVDACARKIIETDAGYAGCFGHGLGHGVGMYIHEAPRLSKSAGECTLAAGEVVTVEPGIYLFGKYGCRIEDMVVVTKDGFMDFTHSDKTLIEL